MYSGRENKSSKTKRTNKSALFVLSSVLKLERRVWRRSRSSSGSVWRAFSSLRPTWKRMLTPVWPASRGGCSCLRLTWRPSGAGAFGHPSRILTHGPQRFLTSLLCAAGSRTTCGSGRSRGRGSAATWRLWMRSSLFLSGSSASRPACPTRWSCPAWKYGSIN